MDNEYNNNNSIETKSADSSSGSYVAPTNSVPASEIYIMQKVFGRAGYFVKMQK